jgi:hypothetical protein
MFIPCPVALMVGWEGKQRAEIVGYRPIMEGTWEDRDERFEPGTFRLKQGNYPV